MCIQACWGRGGGHNDLKVAHAKLALRRRARDATSVRKNMHFFFHAVFKRPSVFFPHFRLRGKQWVPRYIMTHVGIPAELRGACSENSKSLNWDFCQGVAFRLTEPRWCMENPTLLSTARFALTYPLRSPVRRTTSLQLFVTTQLYTASSNSSSTPLEHHTYLLHLALRLLWYTSHSARGASRSTKLPSLRPFTWEFGT